MDITGKHRIPAPRQRVWDALNDPEILKRCLPGCQALESTGDNELTATVTARIGPVSAAFKGKIELADLDPPRSYGIVGRGQGGPAGFAKGSAQVVLEPMGDETLLRYQAQVDIGGKLASVGSRLIAGVANTMAEEFFGRFSRALIGAPSDTQAPAAGASAPAVASRAPSSAGHLPLIDRIAWLLVGIAIGIGGTLRVLGHL